MKVGRTKDWIAAAVIRRSSALFPLLWARGYAAVVPSRSRATAWSLIWWILLLLVLILLMQLLLILLPLLQTGGCAVVVASHSRATVWSLIRGTLLLLMLLLPLLILLKLLLMSLLLLLMVWPMVTEFVVVILVKVHNAVDGLRKTGVAIAVAIVGTVGEATNTVAITAAEAAAEAAVSVVMVGGGGWMAFANATRFT